jgi:6-phosphogluconolactonase
VFSRRQFLITLPMITALPRLLDDSELSQSFTLPHLHQKPAPPPPPTFVYFGTDTAAGAAQGIYLSRFDAANGHLSPAQLIAPTLRPTYLALAPPTSGQQRRLYAVNEVSDPSGTVSSFLINTTSGALSPINQVTSAGAGPCYISVDATGESAFVANYAGSTIASYRIRPDGSLSQPVARIDYKERRFGTRGPVAARQDAPHPHSVHLSPDNRFLLVSDLGSDEISVFPIDPATAELGAPALFSNDRPGSGPRHIAFHPNGRWVYSINELDSTIDHFLWTTTSSRTDPQGLLSYTGFHISTIAPGFPVAKNTAAEVSISADGNFLYASNRGDDSLVVFTIALADGSLTLVQRISCGGKTPRHFTLSSESDERWLLCGNEDSSTVTVFRRDGATGRLGGPVQTISVPSPMFSLFA